MFWPKDCAEIPTYEQLEDTLTLAWLVKDMVEAGDVADMPDDLMEVMAEWFEENDVERFERAYEEAEKHQEMLENTVVDNILFPFPLRTYRKEH